MALPTTLKRRLIQTLPQSIARAAAALPASTAAPIFTVAGGDIALLGVKGEVTTIIQTQANATKLVANPTTGPDWNLCGTLDITALAVGTVLGITGTIATALTKAGLWTNAPMIISPGTIDLDCAATNTGAIAWTLYFSKLPGHDGASVVAA